MKPIYVDLESSVFSPDLAAALGRRGMPVISQKEAEPGDAVWTVGVADGNPEGVSVQRTPSPRIVLHRLALEPDPEVMADAISKEIARQAKVADVPNITLILDQRGQGPRQGRFAIPDDLKDLEGFALVFRPDQGERRPEETLTTEKWPQVLRGLRCMLGYIGGPGWAPNTRRVHLHGDADPSWFWEIGTRMDYSSGFILVADGIEVFGNPRMRPVPTPLDVSDPGPISEEMVCELKTSSVPSVDFVYGCQHTLSLLVSRGNTELLHLYTSVPGPILALVAHQCKYSIPRKGVRVYDTPLPSGGVSVLLTQK